MAPDTAISDRGDGIAQVRALVEQAVERLQSEMVPCSRCKGKGYHHGFGEHGWDPDWCVECGGGQYEQQDPRVILNDLVEAALSALQGQPQDQGKQDDTQIGRP